MVQPLLSSKIIINEEPPQIRSVVTLPTAVLGMVGITERGPVGEPVLSLSFEEWRNTFGGYTLESRDTIAAVEGFFEEGGQFLWFSRTAHYTDVTDAGTRQTARGVATLSTNVVTAAGAALLASAVGPYAFTPGATFTFSVNGGAGVTSTLDAAAASVTGANTGNFALVDGQTLTVRVNGGVVQTATFNTADFASIGAATPAEVAAVLGGDIVGVVADVSSNAVRLRTSGAGTGFSIEIVGGTGAATLGFTAGTSTGTGDVLNVSAVSPAELVTLFTADVAGTASSVVNNRIQISTTATGVAATLAITGGTGASVLGFPSGVVTGVDAAAASPTLRVEGRFEGAYTDELSIAIRPSSSGDAGQFDLRVIRNGVSAEDYANLSMDDTATNYVETVINAAIPAGSRLIRVVDLDAVSATGSAVQQRPANVASVALPGGSNGLVGLNDADFVGDAGEKTGLFALDADTSQPISLLACPARPTAVVHNAMLNYAEVTRRGLVFAILDSPRGLSAQGILDYVRNQALLEESSENGAIYYPLVRVVNPNRTIFGNQDFIEVPPCGHIAGVMSRTDNSQPGGIYTSPAGQQNGRLRTIIGFEILPGRQQPETYDETRRDLIYPARINPLSAQGGFRIIDGARTLRSSGNFPFVNERRGASFIERTISVSLDFARFRNNNDLLRAEVARVVERFLLNQMNLGAFRTRTPATAFFVDFGRGLNDDSVVFAGQLIGRIGLATNKPAEFIILNFTQDTRSQQQAQASL